MNREQLTEHDHEMLNRIRLIHNPVVCTSCTYYRRLAVYPDEDKFYIALGCRCGPQQRLSQLIDTLTDANEQVATLSWKS